MSAVKVATNTLGVTGCGNEGIFCLLDVPECSVDHNPKLTVGPRMLDDIGNTELAVLVVVNGMTMFPFSKSDCNFSAHYVTPPAVLLTTCSLIGVHPSHYNYTSALYTLQLAT